MESESWGDRVKIGLESEAWGDFPMAPDDKAPVVETRGVDARWNLSGTFGGTVHEEPRS